MEKYILNRNGGKTTMIIKKAAESGGTIVCSCLEESDRIYEAANDMGLSIKRPITYWDFRRQAHDATTVTGFLIDNVEAFLQSLTTKPIVAISVTPEPEAIVIRKH